MASTATSLVAATDLHFKQLAEQIALFEMACGTIEENVRGGRFDVDAIPIETEKVEQAFLQVMEGLEGLSKYVAEGEALREGADAKFLLWTDLEHRTRTCFERTMGTLLGGADGIAAAKSIALRGATHNTIPVYVYYDGPGHLFIRGQNAEIRSSAMASFTASASAELRDARPLSWDIGVPLVQESDHLWRINLLVKPGETAEYKFLVSDCNWCKGPNYKAKGTKEIDHVPTFGEMRSLRVPVDVGYGSKVVLCGEGKVQVGGKEEDLSWEKGLDLICLRANLWVLPLVPADGVKYKLCVVNRRGELIWERGANRRFSGAAEVEINPEFPVGVVKARAGSGRASFSPDILLAQERMRERIEAEARHAAAYLEARPLPSVADRGKVFRADEIDQVNPFTRIEVVTIADQDMVFHFTRNGKAVLFQEAREGCTAGVSAMLIIDNGKQPDPAVMKARAAASHTRIADDIRAAGLVPLSTQVNTFGRDMMRLRDQILAHGPAYVRIQEGGGAVGHAIIVDEISPDGSKVRIRDPWHSWECIVKGDSFRRAWHRSLDQCEATDCVVQVRDGVK